MANDRESSAAPLEQRAAALELVLRRKGDLPETFVHDFTEHAEEEWITDNGARMVAKAWTDPAFRARMLADGTAAAKEMGFGFPEHHRQLVVLENTERMIAGLTERGYSHERLARSVGQQIERSARGARSCRSACRPD